MTAQPYARHRLAVLPGLSGSRTNSAIPGDYNTVLGDADNQRQLVPISSAQSQPKLQALNHWNSQLASVRSRESDEQRGATFQVMLSRVSMLEEANKAILEEVYRLGSSVRAAELSAGQKDSEKDRRTQRELMDTIRASNDVIAQLSSRVRKAEEKLHREKDGLHAVNGHVRKLEQSLYNNQKDADSQRTTMMTQLNDLRHNFDGVSRKLDGSDRKSENLLDEFHSMKNKVDMQAMKFAHLQNEVAQRSKRTDDELRQSMEHSRLQKDSNFMAEQNNMQLRHMLETKISEAQESVGELSKRISDSEASGITRTQQLEYKLTELQANLKDVTHQRQEELHSLENTRRERDHSEEGERVKLQKKLQIAVEEMSEKLLQKEVRLREEALRKFIELEKLLQHEEVARVEFERQLRDENENRWNMQQKILSDEIQGMKEMRRTDRTKQASSFRKIEDAVNKVDKRLNQDRKAIEKVLLAEITKREDQSAQINHQVSGVQDQLRLAVSTLQQAVGGIQFQAGKDKEQIMAEVKSRILDEEQKLSRTVGDFDARWNAVTARVTQQEFTAEAKLTEVQSKLRTEMNEVMQSTSDWQKLTNRDVEQIRDTLKALPQDLRETQERLDSLKSATETRSELDQQARIAQEDKLKKLVVQLARRIDELEAELKQEKQRADRLNRESADALLSLSQMGRQIADVGSSNELKLGSERKMRLEESGAMKRDIARLRVDVQPLLWRQHAISRTFVKRSTVSLNEWGIYQCARWFDIKMRWLRLLERSRLNRKNSSKSLHGPVSRVISPPAGENTAATVRKSPTSILTETADATGVMKLHGEPSNGKISDSELSMGGGHPSDDQTSVGQISGDQVSIGRISDVQPSDVEVSDVEDAASETLPTGVVAGGPKEAWYNQDVVNPPQATSPRSEGAGEGSGRRKTPTTIEEAIAAVTSSDSASRKPGSEPTAAEPKITPAASEDLSSRKPIDVDNAQLPEAKPSPNSEGNGDERKARASTKTQPAESDSPDGNRPAAVQRKRSTTKSITSTKSPPAITPSPKKTPSRGGFTTTGKSYDMEGRR